MLQFFYYASFFLLVLSCQQLKPSYAAELRRHATNENLTKELERLSRDMALQGIRQAAVLPVLLIEWLHGSVRPYGFQISMKYIADVGLWTITFQGRFYGCLSHVARDDFVTILIIAPGKEVWLRMVDLDQSFDRYVMNYR
jgi:hypothetical protein